MKQHSSQLAPDHAQDPRTETWDEFKEGAKPEFEKQLTRVALAGQPAAKRVLYRASQSARENKVAWIAAASGLLATAAVLALVGREKNRRRSWAEKLADWWND